LKIRRNFLVKGDAMQLYYSPNAVSQTTELLVRYIDLEADINKVAVDFASGEQRSNEYLAQNPLGRVPLLVTDHGNLTETPAILTYLGRLKPELGLVPTDPWQEAKMQSAMSFLASTMHISWAHGRRGARWSDDPDVIEALKIKVPENMRDAFRIFLEGHFVGPWILGDDLSVADFHLYVIASWVHMLDIDVADFPALADHQARVRAIPSIAPLIDSW